MGIEEYEFLTKTMEHIESESISLAKTKNRLKKLDEEISKMEDKSRRNWGKFNSFKEELGEANVRKIEEVKLPKSNWRTEVRTLKELRRKKLDFLGSLITKQFVPWSEPDIDNPLSPKPPTSKTKEVGKRMVSPPPEWTHDDYPNRKEVLEQWGDSAFTIWSYLYYFTPIMILSIMVALSYYGESNALPFCYDEDGNISNEELVWPSELNNGEDDCTHGGDERALNATEEQMLSDWEKRDRDFERFSAFGICFGPILVIVLSTKYLRPKLEEVVELDSQINVILSKLSGINRRERRRKKYESDLNSVPQREAENAAHDQSLATERRKRDSMRVDIEDLEAKIQRLWESINHLIPYSSELDKN